jgi:vancomycin resistance protein VanJ
MKSTNRQDFARDTITAPADSAQPMRRRNRFVSLIVHLLVWGYLLSLLATWALMHFEGERWWFATLVLFGPRWVFSLPLLIVVPVALLRKRLLWIVAICIVVLAFADLNFAIPWRAWNLPATNGIHLRLMTCNNNRRTDNAGGLSRAIIDANPDIVLLQEWKSDQAAVLFPAPVWHVLIESDMLLASKFPVGHVTNLYPPRSGLEGAAYGYDILLPEEKIRLINLHLASPHLVFRDALNGRPNAPAEIAYNDRMRLIESQMVARYANATTLPTLLAGDFNTPINSETFRTSWIGYDDAFACAGTGLGITYRVKRTWTRIDHILFNHDWQCRNCWLGPDVGSPHLPVMADLQRVP